MATKKTKKRRKPKGKALSEQLHAKDEARRAEEEAAEAEDESDQDEDEDEDGAALMAAALADGDAALHGDELASEPPPSYESEAPRADDEDAEDDEDDDRGDDDDDRDDGDADDDDEDEDEAAAQMGHQRYVIAGFFGLWMVVSYVFGSSVELVWSRVASKDWFAQSEIGVLRYLAAVDPDPDRQLINRVSISLVLGAVVAGLAVLRYYTREDVRTWADEVAEELAKVKWPTRKEVGNNTVVVIAASAIITLYLTLLDRFWAFVTTLIYSSGA